MRLLSRSLIMLASIVEDAAEAKDLYTSAESLYPTMRRLSALNVGEVDKQLEEMRGELDQIKDALDLDLDYVCRDGGSCGRQDPRLRHHVNTSDNIHVNHARRTSAWARMMLTTKSDT